MKINTSTEPTNGRRGPGEKQVCTILPGNGDVISVQWWIKGPSLEKGKQNLHITINGESSSKGANWKQTIPKKFREAVKIVGEGLGYKFVASGNTSPNTVRVTKKHVFISNSGRIDEKDAFSKWNELVAFATLLSEHLVRNTSK